MKTEILPSPVKWDILCERPENSRDKLSQVTSILRDVRNGGDKAIVHFSLLFDGISPAGLRVSRQEISEAAGKIPDDLKNAIARAKSNIEKFHAAQLIAGPVIETSPGVKCWRKNVAIETAGLYIPGGSAPLFSTLLMLGIPAKIAGCRRIVVCTPPGKDGSINPLILYTAGLLELTEIYRVGGAQAIAAMAYGTESIPKADKIFGPGNSFVTLAKELVQLEGVAIDMPAGPSEVLVIADKNADPSFVAADLISQAEHGPDSQVILLTDSIDLLEKVRTEVEKQSEQLPRKKIISRAMENSRLILLNSLEECISFSNKYAPEHLIINTANPYALADKVINAGSVFIGQYSCESMGDYASGTNHTLPTNGQARRYSGLSTESFMKQITFQEANSEGLTNLGPSVALMAKAESLEGHENAVNIRLKKNYND